MSKRIVVCGGNGFLGSRICRAAALRSWHVTSLSRSGAPVWSSVFSSPDPPEWSKSVKWEKADLLDPPSYRKYLEGSEEGGGEPDAVVHSSGILLEADYKGVISGKESPVAGLRRAFSATKQGALVGGSANPMEREPRGEGEEEGGEKLKSGEGDGQITYELMNRDSAIALARESARANIPSFVYISAAAGAPMLPGRYITTKREAESSIASENPKLRTIFMRPGFLYDSARTFTLPIALAGGVGSMVNSMVGGRLTSLFGAAVEKPVKADLVAEAVVEAIDKADVKGVVDTAMIEGLAEKAWRSQIL